MPLDEVLTRFTVDGNRDYLSDMAFSYFGFREGGTNEESIENVYNKAGNDEFFKPLMMGIQRIIKHHQVLELFIGLITVMDFSERISKGICKGKYEFRLLQTSGVLGAFPYCM